MRVGCCLHAVGIPVLFNGVNKRWESDQSGLKVLLNILIFEF